MTEGREIWCVGVWFVPGERGASVGGVMNLKKSRLKKSELSQGGLERQDREADPRGRYCRVVASKNSKEQF